MIKVDEGTYLNEEAIIYIFDKNPVCEIQYVERNNLRKFVLQKSCEQLFKENNIEYTK